MKTVKFFSVLFSALILIACGGGGGGGTPPPSGPNLSVAGASINEGNSGTASLTFTISLSAVSASDVTVDYATSNGSATAGSDYTAASGTATITAGNTSTTVSVSVAGDVDFESDESFGLTLSNASGATLATSAAIGTISNDDSAPPTPLSLSMNNASVTEGNIGTVNLSFTISLSAIAGSDVTVDYATSNGSATAGSDYTSASGTATITAGTTSTMVSISVTGDTTVESDETFTLALSNPSGASITTTSATGTIINDDSAPLPNLSVSNANVNEGNSGTSNLTFTLNLSAASASNVTVDYATSNGSATAGSDYTAASGTATITAGNTSTTVSVSVIGDTTVESNETFTLTLSNVSGANLAIATAIGTIVNDDGVTPTGGPFMTYSDPASGSLYAVDVNDPTKTYLIASGLTGNASVGMEYSQMIITGDLDVGTSSMNNFRPDTFVYFDAGKFWRVDMGAGSNLTPTQISNVNSGSGYVCYMDVIENTIAPADTYIVFVKGTDQTACVISGGQAYAFQVKDNSSVAPTSIPGGPYWGYVGVETMETSATPGVVTGFLVRNSNDATLTRYDVNFSNPAVLKDGVSGIATFVDPSGNAPDGVSFFLVDGVLYSYTHNLSSAMVTTMRTIPGGSSFDSLSAADFSCNLTHCFFVEVDNTTAVQSLYMAAIDGSGSTLMGTAFNTDDIQELSITSGRLYINTAPKSGTGQSLYVVSVSGGTPAVVDSIAIGSFTGMQSAGAYLYYNRVDTSAGMTVSATVLKDDNTIALSPIMNAGWVGFVLSSAQANTAFNPSEYILAEFVTGPTGTRFTTYNAATVTLDTVVGTIDGPSNPAGTFAVGIGDTILGAVTLGTGVSFQSDVIMGDKTIAGSLQKVTDTASVNEFPAF